MKPEATLPTVKQELDRKLLEFVQKASDNLALKNIEPLIVSAQCLALWQVVAGLADEELTTALSMLTDQIGKQPIKVTFTGHGKVRMMVYPPLAPGLFILEIDPTTSQRTVLLKKDAEGFDRAALLDAISADLIAKGYARH
jgi:hypothetical protein